MQKSLKKELMDLDQLIRGWERLVDTYPFCEAYQDNLREVKQKRANVASTLGKREYVIRLSKQRRVR